MAERTLDEDTIVAVRSAIDAAKNAGWDSASLAAYFGDMGVQFADYKRAIHGDPVDDGVCGTLIQVSITGIPPRKLAPNLADIVRHLYWHTEPARGAYDDALVEIAYDDGSGVNKARLFGLDDLEAAAKFAVKVNLAGANVYLGAALRTPDALRDKRSSDEFFYVGCAVPIDIDVDYDKTRAIMAAVVEDAAIVTTGLTPTRRSQHWVKLTEPCDDLQDYSAAFAALVMHTGADQAVKDAARVMRLAGTLSYPNEKKRAKGYLVELVSFAENPNARPSTIGALKALAPGEFTGRKWEGDRPEGNGIERDWTGRVINGREAHFRDLLLRHLRLHQIDTGLDPNALELFSAAFEEFIDPAKVDNKDGRWTCEDGKQQLLARARNTLRRLGRGRLAGAGLWSRETGVEKELAESVQAERDQAHAERSPGPKADFVEDEAPEPTADPPKPPPPAAGLPDHLLHPPGVLGEITDWIVATSRYPMRPLALVAAISLLGTVAGRGYATPTRSGTHLYALVLAGTGAGKNHAPKQIKRILRAANMSEMIGPSRYMSMSAVFGELDAKPKHLAIIDEFGAEIARITSAKGGSPHERAVKDILRTAWGASFEELRPLSYADRSRNLDPIINPSLSIHGMSTPEEFYKALAGDDVFNGFLNRFLIIRTADRPAEKEPDADEFEVPGNILWGLQKIKDRISGRLTAALANDERPVLQLPWENDAAKARYTALRRSIEAREEDAAMLSRVAEMACRLATIRALARSPEDNSPTVNSDDMEWGEALAMASAEGMIRDSHEYMAESEHQRRTMKVLRVIKASPGAKIKHRDLLLKLKHEFNARDLEVVLQGLQEAEQIAVIETKPTSAGGRKGKSYAAV